MIVVRVELHSARTGLVTEIARAVIHNVGGTAEIGEYEAITIRGRDKQTFDKRILEAIYDGKNVARKGEVSGYPRKRLHVWNLVAKALYQMGYGHGKNTPEIGEDDIVD